MTYQNDHIEYRKGRYATANIMNDKLIGLAVVEINPTELCNRKCSFCPRSDSKIYPNRNIHMSIETAKILCDQLVLNGFNGDINITGFGEPLLNPNILHIIEIFSKHFYTEMVSNGDKILKEDIDISEIEKTGLNSLIVDCYDDETQVEWFSNKFKDVKFSYKIRIHFDNDDTQKLIKKYNFTNRAGAVFNTTTKKTPCFLPSYKAFVDWNGDIRLCCNDWLRKQPSFGNLHDTDFSDIWNSEFFTRVRKELFLGNRNLFAPCSNCTVDGMKVGKDSALLWR